MFIPYCFVYKRFWDENRQNRIIALINNNNERSLDFLNRFTNDSVMEQTIKNVIKTVTIENPKYFEPNKASKR